MPRFSIINPASFANMAILKMPDQEVMLSDRMKLFAERWKELDPPMGAEYDVGALEFDPSKIIQEVGVTAQLNVMSRINLAAKAVTLAFATGTDLDAIASRYPGGVPRVASEIYASTDSIMDRMLKDARYRDRIWLSPNALARTGTAEGYEFLAKTAVPEARDVSATAERRPDQVTAVITLLMNRPDPRPTQADMVLCYQAIDTEENLGLTDVLRVQGPGIIDFTYEIEVWLWPWADLDTVMGTNPEAIDPTDEELGTVRKAFLAKLEELRWLGADHALTELMGALGQYGVHSALIKNFPGEVIQAGETQYIRPTIGSIHYAGRRK